MISENLIELRHRHNLSQRDLAQILQITGCDMDKNVITKIETQKRFATDLEIKKLCEVLTVGSRLAHCKQYACHRHFPLLFL